MTQLAAIQPGLATQPGPQTTTGEESESRNNLASDFDTFLQLLTAQIQNQDPSDPVDSTQWVAQLASFSAVEQQISTNEKLDELLAINAKPATDGLTQWIGAEVLSTAASNFNGAAMDVFFTAPASADAVRLKITSEAGALINRIPIDPSSSSYAWDGTDFDGNEAPLGAYIFELETYEDGEKTGTLSAETFSPVVEARAESNGTILVFADGTRKPAADVAAVRGSPSSRSET